MRTIKELELHELTQHSKLPIAAREILNAQFDAVSEEDEADAVTAALIDATKDYENKTAALLERHKDDLFQAPYGEAFRIEHLHDSASINAGDTCEDYGINAERDRWFYNYTFALVELNTLLMEIDGHPII